MIASKLDKDIAAKQCRLAFYGQVIQLGTADEALYHIKITKDKVKKGRVDRVQDARNIIVKDLFKKETAVEVFMNKGVDVMGLKGVINGTFGKSGK